MDTIWSILGLEPTQDEGAIRRAYARRAQACHPEEDPEGFLALREAYQAALAYAEGVLPERDPDTEASEETAWRLTEHLAVAEEGPNPYQEHEAVRTFLDLYTGKQRKDSKRWLDYFTSDAFLDAAWERPFAALLLAHAERLEETCPPTREFLNWLCTAYQFTVSRAVYCNPDGSERVEYQFRIDPGAEFDGQELIFALAAKGPAPKPKRGNELAVSYSFTEYRALLRMAQEGVWSEQEVGEFSQVIGRYAAGYITDKCQQRGDMDYERHPGGLRLMTHFLGQAGLPEELYRIAWEKLDLRTAVLGRSKLLYGAMRERVLERLPELAGAAKPNYAKLRIAFREYAVSTYKRGGEEAQATPEDIQRTDAFFAREDVQKALLDRRIVEEEMLHTWVSETRCDYYLKRVIGFYTEHETAPCAGKVIRRAEEMLRYQSIADRLRRDREAGRPEGELTLKNSSFFRHWLNTGFYQARDPESGTGLLEWLNRELPFLPEWGTEFLGASEERIAPKVLTCAVGDDAIEVRFHLRYMEFWRNQTPVYRPCLAWERVAGLENTDSFFFVLPITMAAYDQFQAVKEEICRRLAQTAAPEDARALLAACLAERVCSLPRPDEVGLAWARDGEDGPGLSPESLLPFELYAEDLHHLYGCAWDQRGGILRLFEQLPIGRQLLRNGLVEGVEHESDAVVQAKQLLAETLAPPPIPVECLASLPDAVYVQPDFKVLCRKKDVPSLWLQPMTLEGEAVTAEALAELLERFSGGGIQRLELAWNLVPPLEEAPDWGGQRSLVVLKSGRDCACLYFDDLRGESFALLEKPELYGKMRGRVELVPFRQGKLFSQVIHRSFSSIRRRLDVVFQQAGRPNGVTFMACGLWDWAVNVAYGRSKYYLDKRELADFPLERAHSRADALVYFLSYPALAVVTDGQGPEVRLEVDELRRGRLQELLVQFWGGGWPKLRMSWGEEAGRRQHIVLLQDGGRFLLAWIEEEKRQARYHVADVRTYMDVEGKKYPKGVFQGKEVPAYLIHEGVMPLRGALELLLANLDNPASVTDKIAEYALEKPWKPRSYEAVWADLVGEA